MKADPKAEAAAAPKASPKKLILIIILAVLTLAVGGAATWYFTLGAKGGADVAQKKEKAQPGEPPVYVPIEKFVVNLQPEEGEQYLQIQFTLQVPTLEEVEVLKANMPKVQSRVLLLLSAKKASELSTPEGKQQLSSELIASINAPFVDKGEPQEVTDVLYTSFIIQ
ncbi:flagellar basal body-associated protein FliL [Massilia cavernae]|uniref:Flagellar protein FliL n=1 Tax=Massilia cavernae TaxID=2320864 RepID=A0A418XSM0_9BURK|nr:flagellar basal body-associated protein FliL [Massilia cavernae]RJG15582.1 flagellar basal body-associated protein FliL [Massilia cavernae]